MFKFFMLDFKMVYMCVRKILQISFESVITISLMQVIIKQNE